MKKVSFILSAVVMTAMMLSSCGEGASNEEVTTGKQVWMTKNLNVDKFRNGDPIPHAETQEEWEKAGENQQPAWCYYDNDPANGEKYGKLYNWYAVNDPRGLAPEGWHIPTEAEWTELIDFLGGESIAGTKMKSTSGWAADYDGESGNGTNESGFSGLPGGYRTADGSFKRIGETATWWSSSVSSKDNAGRIFMDNDRGEVYTPHTNKGRGVAVRCIRD